MLVCPATLFGVATGLVADNYIQDSFARGINLTDVGDGVKLSNNTAIRCPVLHQHKTEGHGHGRALGSGSGSQQHLWIEAAGSSSRQPAG
jgi:hypothetical protein